METALRPTCLLCFPHWRELEAQTSSRVLRSPFPPSRPSFR
ncbi:unnamed protein product, partial [Gulo gulo]